jgi:hypothetical protein
MKASILKNDLQYKKFCREIALYVRQLSLRAKTGVFRPFLRGNLVSNG